MKKYIFSSLLAIISFYVNAQVRINNTSPQVTLDIQTESNLPDTQPQGISFPNFA